MKNCEKLDRSLKIFKHQLILNYCKLVAKDNIIARRDYASNKSEVLTLGSFTVVLVYFNRCIFSDHILVAWCPENFPAENQICLKFRDYGRQFLPTVSLYQMYWTNKKFNQFPPNYRQRLQHLIGFCGQKLVFKFEIHSVAFEVQNRERTVFGGMLINIICS